MEGTVMKRKTAIFMAALGMMMTVGLSSLTVQAGISASGKTKDWGNSDSGDVDESTAKYPGGQYKVGIDIPSGEYVLFASGGTGYFCISSDSNADDIITNENFDYNTIVTISDGQYFELVRCYAVPFNDVAADDLDLSGEGMFKVGTHIPAGEYKIKADSSGMGYYCIYDSSTQENIVSNNNFDSSQYVTVQDGQYLQLVRCSFESIPEVVYEDTETIKAVQEKLNQLGYDCGTPDGIPGQNTQNAILQFEKDNEIGEDVRITQSLLDKLNQQSENIALSDMPEGMVADEDVFNSWKLEKPCMLSSFMSSEDFTFSIPFGQSDSAHKTCTFSFVDGDDISILKDVEFYYCVEDQQIMYAGFDTSDETIYKSEDFREACVRLMMRYNSTFDSETRTWTTNLSRNRAEEIVNYCLDNQVNCTVDNMRIRVIEEPEDNFYSFHIEY